MYRSPLPLLLCLFCLCTAQAFEIELPKGYIEKRNAKWKKEALTIWREIDRAEVQGIIEEFVRLHPKIDGVDLSKAISDLTWKFEDSGVIRCGPWSVSLLEWETTYPALSRIKWSEATLLASIAYDWKTKEVGGEGTGGIRLSCSLTRKGPILGRKTIFPEFHSFDYGEVYILLPFGGVELRKEANQPPRATPVSAPR